MKDIIKRMRNEYNHLVTIALFERTIINRIRKSPKNRSVTKKQMKQMVKNYEVSLQKIRDLDQEITEAAKLINEFNG